MPTLREMQATWNSLVPQAQALGIRRVRLLNLPLETKQYREAKLSWLQGEIERLSATTAIRTIEVSDISVFTFGVELEFIMPVGMTRRELARLITAAGVACNEERYGHTTGSNWKLVTDGSLGDYSRGTELVSPVLRGSAGFDQLTIACNVMKQVGCKVTKKCGYHVHVGAQAWTVQTFKNLVMLYRSSEAHIDTFMAPSRRAHENMYCAPVHVDYAALDRANTIDAVAHACGQDPGSSNVRGSGRYKKLNLQSFWQHGTVEFRHHQGTVEADKAVNWAKLCMRLCAAAADGARAAESLDALFAVAKAHPDEKAFFEGRAAFFAAQVARSERAQDRRRHVFTQPARPAQVSAASTNPFTETGTELQRRAFGQE